MISGAAVSYFCTMAVAIGALLWRPCRLIIDGIRDRGLELVPVSQLLGKTRAEIMPPLSTNERWSARVDWFAFALGELVMKAIPAIFFLGDILMTGRLIFVGLLAIIDRLRRRSYGSAEELAAFRPNVALLIPAFNEEKVIERTILAALDSDYPNLRVIVIDDGSTDNTLEVAPRWHHSKLRRGI